jgi:hypothetical protein
VVLIVVGGLTLLSLALRTSETETETFAEQVSAVSIDSDAGPVEVVGEDREDVAVTVTRTWGLGERPTSTVEVDGDTLQIEGDCPLGWLFWWANPCSTAYEVAVPGDVAVTVSTSGGSVTVSAVQGGVDAESSAGSVVLTDVAGTIRARSSAGSVTGTVASTDVEAVSSAGAVRITDTVVPDRIEARSSAGAVEVVVPDEIYRVEASTSAGQETVEVDTSQDSPHVITAISSAGNVSVRRSNPR